MPAFLAPHKSGAHRVTAIALYRALLAKCRSAPPPIEAAALKHVVRNTFAKNRHVTSKYTLRDAFAGGYEALDHLDAAKAGDGNSISHITSLLSRIPANLKSAPRPTAPKTPPPPPPRAEVQTPPSLLVQPRPAFSLPTNRRIPVLVSANKIPILRFKKPQPASLSHYLKSRIVARQRRQDLKDRLESAAEIAKAEDEWDRLVRGRGVEKDGKKEDKWGKVVHEALKVVRGRIEDEAQRNRRVAEWMVGIVERERKLAEVERKGRVRVRNEVRRKRKAESDGLVGKRGDGEGEGGKA